MLITIPEIKALRFFANQSHNEIVWVQQDAPRFKQSYNSGNRFNPMGEAKDIQTLADMERENIEAIEWLMSL